LGLTEMEMSENEMMWAEEHGEADAPEPGQSEMRAAGVSAGGIASDLEAVGTPADAGAEGATSGAAPATGGAAPATSPAATPAAG
jgi:hypothetical protein